MPLEKLYDYEERCRERCVRQEPYGWSQAKWNTSLQAEFATYRDWRTRNYVAQRPKRLRQRANTFEKTTALFECYFGYLVNKTAVSPDDLRLRLVAESQHVQRYVDWHSAQRVDGMSRYMVQSVGLFARIARYYLPDVAPAAVIELDRLRQSLDPDSKRDKLGAWLSLATLDEVGCAEYPGLVALAQAGTEQEKILLALAAQRSLLIRLAVRRPLRSRNLREMQIGRNLFQDGGRWKIEFRGSELKVGKVRGKVNIYRASFPPDLEDALDEFLKIWRPLLPIQQRRELFVTRWGNPFTANALNTQFQKTDYAYTQHATHIHLVRDIWATEFIEGTQNFSGAADMLGDTLETVLRHYAHLQRIAVCEQADEFIARQIARNKLATPLSTINPAA